MVSAGDRSTTRREGAPSRRTGRRRGRPETRQEIVDAARELFAERGFTGTSIRAIGAAASVDPALVHHYFGTKEGLFRAVLQMPVDPEDLVRQIIGAGGAETPRRLVETFLGVWDSPETGPAMVGFLRRALADQHSTELLRDFFGATVLRTATSLLLGEVDSVDADSRVALVMSQMVGVVVLRKVLAVEPLASMSVERLAAELTPTISRYLYGDTTGPGGDPTPSPPPGSGTRPPAGHQPTPRRGENR